MTTYYQQMEEALGLLEMSDDNLGDVGMPETDTDKILYALVVAVLGLAHAQLAAVMYSSEQEL
jgi:hypothetical protein